MRAIILILKRLILRIDWGVGNVYEVLVCGSWQRSVITFAGVRSLFTAYVFAFYL